MKKIAAKVTLATVLSVGLIFTTSLPADANAPRWPEPAWFAQFSQQAQPAQPPQPQPEPKLEPQQPAPVPTPAPTPAPAPTKPTEPSTQPATTNAGWLSPQWYALYNSQSNTGQPAQSAPTAPGSPTGGQNQAHQLTAQELQLANLVNQERSQRGTKTLQVDPELSKWARIKSQDMVDNNYFAHQSPTYGKASEMLRNGGVSVRFVGENLAKANSVTRAHELFMGSSVHRSQVLSSNYTHIGIGIAYKGSTLYVTQLFAAK